ncbi:MAG TPA: DNA mismatch repair endonuclease MutL [Clostridiaceae bacterium]|nr:DNA mismatch repair endonuclease MutL [Clostridiaceae bacterium]
MGKIITLDENTINKIAAGEVIERPASVVKELMENSIDAGAKRISAEIKKGGISLIKVTDDGCGIEEDDVQIAFERHSTSKIKHSEDLSSILTLGFRGEALASIAAVSKVEMVTRTANKSYGINIFVEGGKIQGLKKVGAPIGTTVTVRELFYNTPARFKFLKKDSTETGYVSDIISRIALGNPDISIKFINNGTVVIHTPGNNDLLSTIASIYGTEIIRYLSEINYREEYIKITGYAGSAEISRGNRNHQSVFVNGRYIKSKIITSAIDEAYKTILMKGRFPFVVLKVEINTAEVDVNVHPAKLEVRFSNENDVFRAVYNAVISSLVKGAKISEYNGKTRINSIPVSAETRDTIKEKQQTIDLYDQNRGYINKNKELRESKDLLNDSNNACSYGGNDLYVYDKDSHAKDMEAGDYRFDNNYNNNNFDNNYGRNYDNEYDNDEYENNEYENGEYGKGEYGNDIEQIRNSKIVGHLFSTYILLQKNDCIFIVDQHAAHERIMFERLREKFKNNQNLAQFLITPVLIELTYQELQQALENKNLLNKLGFIFEEFGNNSILLRSMPYKDQEGDEKEVFFKVLDCITTYSGKLDNGLKLEEEALYQIACKAAIKANLNLDDREKYELINELIKLDNPYTCPHGRPTIIKVYKDDIEKMFKRKV